MGSKLYPLRPLNSMVDIYDYMRIPVKKSDRKPGPYPYYGASGIVDYVDSYIFDGEYLLLAEDGENLRSLNTPIAFMASGKFWVNNHAHILKRSSDNSTKYLHYALQYADIQSYLSGSTRPKLTQSDMKRILVHYPHPYEQRAIAHILGSLDDKIELNRQMNRTLEAMAQAIFKSWFVDFLPVRAKQSARTQTGDPVHAKAEGRDTGLPAEIAKLFPDSFEESELGLIPKGWNSSFLGQEFQITMGQSPPGNTYNEIGEGLSFFQGRRDFGFRFPSKRVYCTAPKRIAKYGDTLVSVRAPVGDINMALNECCIGRGVAGIRHNSESRSYTYYTMKTLSDTFAQFEADGTVFGAINKNQFADIPWLSISKDIVDMFESFVFPYDEYIYNNSTELTGLINIRDILLPKLISGELRVPDVEDFIGTVV
ncbi:restriction endonuclease subunit S [bacterium]|nr:restriction endonuclease subunit S [bacterium]